MKYNYKSIFGSGYVSVVGLIGLLFLSLVLSVIMFRFDFGAHCKRKVKEGFFSGPMWSDDLIKRFNLFQQTMTDNTIQYNLGVLQKQASPAEAETLLKTGYWPWSDDIKYIYQDAIWRQPIIKANVSHALDYAMKTHNESAAKLLLSWKEKEGQFLLYGAKGTDKGLYDTIKCSSDENNKSTVVGRIKKSFMDEYIENNECILDKDIPKHMPGFSFVNEPCNPCSALHNDYSCPFKLNVGGDDSVTPIWKKLWSL